MSELRSKDLKLMLSDSSKIICNDIKKALENDFSVENCVFFISHPNFKILVKKAVSTDEIESVAAFEILTMLLKKENLDLSEVFESGVLLASMLKVRRVDVFDLSDGTWKFTKSYWNRIKRYGTFEGRNFKHLSIGEGFSLKHEITSIKMPQFLLFLESLIHSYYSKNNFIRLYKSGIINVLLGCFTYLGDYYFPSDTPQEVRTLDFISTDYSYVLKLLVVMEKFLLGLSKSCNQEIQLEEFEYIYTSEYKTNFLEQVFKINNSINFCNFPAIGAMFNLKGSKKVIISLSSFGSTDNIDTNLFPNSFDEIERNLLVICLLCRRFVNVWIYLPQLIKFLHELVQSTNFNKYLLETLTALYICFSHKIYQFERHEDIIVELMNVLKILLKETFNDELNKNKIHIDHQNMIMLVRNISFLFTKLGKIEPYDKKYDVAVQLFNYFPFMLRLLDEYCIGTQVIDNVKVLIKSSVFDIHKSRKEVLEEYTEIINCFVNFVKNVLNQHNLNVLHQHNFLNISNISLSNVKDFESIITSDNLSLLLNLLKKDFNILKEEWDSLKENGTDPVYACSFVLIKSHKILNSILNSDQILFEILVIFTSKNSDLIKTFNKTSELEFFLNYYRFINSLVADLKVEKSISSFNILNIIFDILMSCNLTIEDASYLLFIISSKHLTKTQEKKLLKKTEIIDIVFDYCINHCENENYSLNAVILFINSIVSLVNFSVDVIIKVIKKVGVSILIKMIYVVINEINIISNKCIDFKETNLIEKMVIIIFKIVIYSVVGNKCVWENDRVYRNFSDKRRIYEDLEEDVVENKTFKEVENFSLEIRTCEELFDIYKILVGMKKDFSSFIWRICVSLSCSTLSESSIFEETDIILEIVKIFQNKTKKQGIRKFGGKSHERLVDYFMEEELYSVTLACYCLSTQKKKRKFLMFPDLLRSLLMIKESLVLNYLTVGVFYNIFCVYNQICSTVITDPWGMCVNDKLNVDGLNKCCKSLLNLMLCELTESCSPINNLKIQKNFDFLSFLLCSNEELDSELWNLKENEYRLKSGTKIVLTV
jgi:hypothetical protein